MRIRMNRSFASSIFLAAFAAGSLFAQPAGTRNPAAPVPPPAFAGQGSAGLTNVIPADSIRAVYMTVTSSKQGVIGKGKIKLLKYEYQLTSPREVATGLATGKVSAAPINVTKAWDAASAPLLEALETNAVVSVTFDFLAITGDGKQQQAFTVKLTNATVAAINQNVDASAPAGSEDVRFTYQKIEFADAHNSSVGITGAIAR